MKIRMAGFRACLALSLLVPYLAAPGPVAAADHEGIGMCNGRHDAFTVVIAHSSRVSPIPKYVLNVATDALGVPTGSLVFGQGPTRLVVDDWCRVWQHLPGQPSGGSCEASPPEGAITAHAVGTTILRDGRLIVVRTDVRETDEGRFFRLRYRVPDTHETLDAHEEEDCDEGWTRYPEEGWAPLEYLMVRIETEPD